jgi:hypothetical protein
VQAVEQESNGEAVDLLLNAEPRLFRDKGKDKAGIDLRQTGCKRRIRPMRNRSWNESGAEGFEALTS